LSSRVKLLQIYLQHDTRLQHCLLVLLSQSKEKKRKVMARLIVSLGLMSTMRVCTISYLHRWPSIARSAKFLQTTQKQFRTLLFSSLILYIRWIASQIFKFFFNDPFQLAHHQGPQNNAMWGWSAFHLVHLHMW
jgi:hypothetical protein